MLRRSVPVLVLLLAVSTLGPPARTASDFVPLREARDPRLQAALEQTLRAEGLGDAVRRKRLGVALAGITDPSCPRLASVNGDTMMYAASLPKIAILLAAFLRVQEGALELDAENRELLTEMIRRSSNRAATEMMERVGRRFILQVLESPRFRLYDPDFGGGLWVGKDYSKRPAWRRDPLRNLSHGATPVQVARFYYLLESGRLLSPELTREMKAMLGDPGLEHKFVAGLQRRHPGARIYRKSGTWRSWHSDSALIEHDGKRYIAVALVDSPRGEQILRRLIVALDALIFRVPPSCPSPAEPAAGALPR